MLIKQKIFTIFVTIHHVMSCEWWKCEPIIFSLLLTTRHGKSYDFFFFFGGTSTIYNLNNTPTKHVTCEVSLLGFKLKQKSL